MNFINSFTSGFNFNFGGNFFNGGNVNSNNVNYEYQDSDNSGFEELEFEEENEDEENEDDAELFNRKKNRFNCPICLQKYKNADIIKEFPCKHIFHKNCIFKWLKQSNVCPICKHDLTEDINKVEIGEEEDNE